MKRRNNVIPVQLISPHSYKRLARARAFIDAHSCLPLDLNAIADQSNFSRYHFIRLFKRVFHTTPHQYLTHRRIEHARRLLESSELSVTDVCFAVGFQSVGSFCSLFHRYVGLSPAVYRARRQSRRQSPDKFVPGCFLMMFGAERSPSSE